MIELRGRPLVNPEAVHANQSAPALIEQAVRRGEGVLAERGALVVSTGKYTGRAPKDRYIVADANVKDQVDWGAINQPLDPAVFARLADKVAAYLQNRELFVFDGWACADPAHRLGVRVVAEKAWHALFAHCLLICPSVAELRDFSPDFTILAAADLLADPKADGTRSEIFILLGFAEKLVLIGGTHYAGEIKKSVFSLLNYLLPFRGVFPMHCSANIGLAGDTALFCCWH